MSESSALPNNNSIFHLTKVKQIVANSKEMNLLEDTELILVEIEEPLLDDVAILGLLAIIGGKVGDS